MGASLGRFPADAPAVMDALSNPTRFLIASTMEHNKRLRFSELLTLTGHEPGSLSPHLKKLQAGGILRKVSSMHGERVTEYYELTPFGQRLLDQLHAVFAPLVRVRTTTQSSASQTREVDFRSRPGATQDAATGSNSRVVFSTKEALFSGRL